MILWLFAIGALPSAVTPPTTVAVTFGTVDLGTDATAVFSSVQGGGSTGSGLPSGSPAVARAIDPNDRVPLAFDFKALMIEGQTIADVRRVTMSALAASYGVQVDQDSARAAVIDQETRRVQLWFLVDPAQQASSAFAGDGAKVGVSVLIRTNLSPYREFERTAILTVRQQ